MGVTVAFKLALVNPTARKKKRKKMGEPQSTTAVGSTTAASTPAPVTTSAAPATTAIGTCAGPWEQCGGNGWTGTTCCASGYFCNALSEWHSQCDPVSRRLNKGLRR